MPEHASLDVVADHLYVIRPDEFVPARDDAVAQAREQGDKELARAIGRLRRPTKAAWLANLLARRRGEQLAALLSLAGDLADAQRTLDGGALRALSSQRHRLVAAMAREAGRLAYDAGDSAGGSVLRELQGILDAALADPNVAEEVRAGRLTRTVAHSGFGPAGDPDAVPRPAARPTLALVSTTQPTSAPTAAEYQNDSEQQRREERERERVERKRALDDAEREEAEAVHQQETDEATRTDTESAHTAAKEQVADLTTELESARERERSAATAARAAASTAKDSARAAGAATTRTARARARFEEYDVHG